MSSLRGNRIAIERYAHAGQLHVDTSCVPIAQGGDLLGQGGGAAVPCGEPAQVHGLPVIGLDPGQWGTLLVCNVTSVVC